MCSFAAGSAVEPAAGIVLRAGYNPGDYAVVAGRGAAMAQASNALRKAFNKREKNP
jgi:hypothetical protein